ncbi:flippase [Colwellia sp. BRX8-7]|jgi:O-antigen/teichoic acid export membrane protein|uniref:flippase n=1 Tax=Colwellia sp. BRX8-7 TaxID=2759833 RepID=UPI0015F3A142|nr:flippase [Colwellia sp. BRX8-7]MBA6335678.1 flippase [Colwellia sp. BRX8-7]
MTLIKNSLWNMLPVIIPAAIALPSLGFLSRGLGLELFGVYTLIFALLGYSGVFDFGMSRAVTRAIAIKRDDIQEVVTILSTSSIIVLVLSIIPSSLLFFFTDNVVAFFNISKSYVDEVNYSLKLLTFIIPIYIANIVLLSYFEGQERFKEFNLIRLTGNSLVSILPVIFLFVGESFFSAFLGLLVGRIISFIIVLLYIYIEVNKNYYYVYDSRIASELIKFGGWISISNLIIPIMVYFDRFILASMSGAGVVALYSSPSELVSKMLAIPGAVSRALFPSSSYEMSINKNTQAFMLTFILSVLMALPVMLFSEWLLTVWLGSEFSKASIVLKILCIGFIFSSMSQIPYCLLQAKGLSKVTTIAQLCQLFPYLILLYVLISKYAFVGAAVAWSVRMFADFIIFIYLRNKLVK